MAVLEINIEACKSCGFCIHVCAKNVLKIGDMVNKSGYHYVVQSKPEACVGCQRCAVMCPDTAIEIYKES